MDPSTRGVVLVAGSAIVWSTGGLIVRLLDTADSWTTIFWRSATACLFLLVFMAIRDGRDTVGLFRRMGWPGLVVALSFTCASISLVVALSLTSVAKTLMIMSTAPLIAAILGRAFLGEKIRPATALTIVAVMAGVALMVSESSGADSLLGDCVALLIAFSIAVAIVTTRHHTGIRMIPAVCTGTAIAMLLSAGFAAPLLVSFHDFSLLAIFGAGQLGVGLALFVTGVRLIPAAHSALVGMLEPILGPIWVWLALAEMPPATVLIGGAVVLVAVTINTLYDFRRQR